MSLESRSDDSPEEIEEIVITMVHGTWGRGPCRRRRSNQRWFEPGSRFSRELHSVLGSKYRIRPIFRRTLWSGANSLKARDEAATRLCSRLECQKRRWQQRRRIVIAHSHGGNVALKALEQLGGDLAVELITLATPFVSLRPRRGWREYLALLLVTLFLGVFALVALAEQLTNVWYLQLAITVSGAVAASLPIALAAEIFKRGRKSVVRVSHDGATRVPTLCLRGRSDEASLALAVGAFGAELGHYLTRGLGSLALGLEPLRKRLAKRPRLAVFEMAGPFYALVLTALVILLVATEPQSTAVLFLLAIAAIAVWITGVLIVSLSLSALGGELLWSGVGMIAAVESVPDGRGNVDIVTLPAPASGLRHVIYENPECVPRIAEWIAGSEPQPETAEASAPL